MQKVKFKSFLLLIFVILLFTFIVGCRGGGTPSVEEKNKIAFISYRDGNWEIYVMNSDGSNQKRFTNNLAEDWYPSWSP